MVLDEIYKDKVGLPYLDLLNTTIPSKKGLMPRLVCNCNIYPDFLALFSETGKYYYSNLTAVCFYQWDSIFDGKDGLLNSIKYNDIDKLNYFKNRFKNVKFFISADFSLINNTYQCINQQKVFYSYLVSLWFTNVLGAVVIPNITYTDFDSLSYSIDGLYDCKVVAINIMSCLNGDNCILLKKILVYLVDNLNLEAIVVYTSSSDTSKILKLFEYAIINNVKIIIPDNTLLLRNRNKLYGKN